MPVDCLAAQIDRSSDVETNAEMMSWEVEQATASASPNSLALWRWSCYQASEQIAMATAGAPPSSLTHVHDACTSAIEAASLPRCFFSYSASVLWNGKLCNSVVFLQTHALHCSCQEYYLAFGVIFFHSLV